MKKTFLLMMALLFSMLAHAQRFEPQPEVGKPMPNFNLNNITHYKATKASLADFKGKWLFLDFWFIGCSSCIASFPKINEFQRWFGDEIQYMLVAVVNDKPGSFMKIEPTKRIYEKLRVKQSLIIPCVYDSILASGWGINAMPHVIIVDPNGIVRAITNGGDLTKEKIGKLLNNETPKLFLTKGERPEFDSKWGDLRSGVIDSLVYLRSMFLKYNGEEPSGLDIDYSLKEQKDFASKGYKFAGYPLYMIYNLAYFGDFNWGNNSSLYNQVYPKPILNLKDSTSFEWNVELNKGQYNYSLIFPPFSKPTKQMVMQVLQNDLENCFGYETRIETRKMPIYSLIAKPGAIEKLRNKGRVEDLIGEGSCPAGFTAIRKRIKGFLFSLLTQHLKELRNIPISDETGITDRIDITIDADMSKIDDVKRELQKNGLDLVLGEKEYKVLVISDRTPHILITASDFTYESAMLKAKDSLAINSIIGKYVSPDKVPNWIGLSSALKLSYPQRAEEITWRTKTEYYKAKKNVVDFEYSVQIYTSKFIQMIPPSSLQEYAEFIAHFSMNEDLLEDANEWRKIYLDDSLTNINTWFTSAGVLYKLGMLKNHKGAIDLGKYFIEGGISYMKSVVLKSEPNNNLYQETLEKMEKGEPTWSMSSEHKPQKN
jgi:thiol-disulfide isomerase/thioredoxin